MTDEDEQYVRQAAGNLRDYLYTRLSVEEMEEVAKLVKSLVEASAAAGWSSGFATAKAEEVN